MSQPDSLHSEDMPHAEEPKRKKKRRKNGKSCSCGCGGACAAKSCEMTPERLAEIKARASALRKNKDGKLVSARSKTGNPACSAAMSQWKKNGMSPAVAATLGKCRAQARLQRAAEGHRGAGREGVAANLEKRAGGQYVTQKERLSRAQELRAKRGEKRGQTQGSAASPMKPASEIDAEGRQYLASQLSRTAGTVQAMRKARYMSTVEAGRGKGTVDRAALAEYRKQYGVTPDSVAATRKRMANLRAEAESLGYRGNEAVALGRRLAMQEIRDQYAGGRSFLNRGSGYYPSPGERVRANAPRQAENAANADKFRREMRVSQALKENEAALAAAAQRSAINVRGTEARKQAAKRIREQRNRGLDAKPAAGMGRMGRTLLPNDLRKGDEVFAGSPVGILSMGVAATDGGNAKLRRFADMGMVKRGDAAHPVRQVDALAKIRERRAQRASRQSSPPAVAQQQAATPSLREQAAAARAKRGLSAEQRAQVARNKRYGRVGAIPQLDNMPKQMYVLSGRAREAYIEDNPKKMNRFGTFQSARDNARKVLKKRGYRLD